MLRKPAAVLLPLCLVLAGCLGNGSTDDAADEPVEPSVAPPIGTEPILRAPDAVAAAAWEPTLDEPPQWARGQWWKYRLTDVFTGQTTEVLRVVAGIEGEHYLVGMPTDPFNHDIMVLHIPGYGQVKRSDLSFEIHDSPFEPLKFPLQNGQEWDTTFEGRPVHATARVIEPLVAEVELIGENDQLTITYDARVQEIVRLVHPQYGTLEIIDSGTGHEGLVTVPHMHDLIFIQFRVAGVLTGGLQPAPPIETIEVDSTYDRVSFAIILGGLADGPTAGVFGERVTAPDGTVYEALMTPADNLRYKVVMYGHDNPGGVWQFEHIAGGAGFAGAEGIAYHVYDVELPSGRILPSTGEHQHGG